MTLSTNVTKTKRINQEALRMQGDADVKVG